MSPPAICCGTAPRRATAVVDPGVLLSLVHAEGQGRIEGEGLVLADEVIARRMRALHGALLHRVHSAEGRNDFAGTEYTDLELAVGDCGHAFGDCFTATIDRVQAFRKTRRATPPHLWEQRCLRHGLCSGRRREHAEAGARQKLSAIHETSLG